MPDKKTKLKISTSRIFMDPNFPKKTLAIKSQQITIKTLTSDYCRKNANLQLSYIKVTTTSSEKQFLNDFSNYLDFGIINISKSPLIYSDLISQISPESTNVPSFKKKFPVCTRHTKS